MTPEFFQWTLVECRAKDLSVYRNPGIFQWIPMKDRSKDLSVIVQDIVLYTKKIY